MHERLASCIRWRSTGAHRGEVGDYGDDAGRVRRQEDTRLCASDELTCSRSGGVVEVTLDVGDDRDSTPPTVASRRATGNGKRCVRLSRRCRCRITRIKGGEGRAAASSTTSGSRQDDELRLGSFLRQRETKQGVAPVFLRWRGE
jgi:hypothetical protein